MLAETVRSCGPYATASVVPPGGLRKALRIETRRQLCAGGKRLRTRGPRYMADAFETILVAWLAFAFLPERPTRSRGGTDGSKSAFLQRKVTNELSGCQARLCILYRAVSRYRADDPPTRDLWVALQLGRTFYGYRGTESVDIAAVLACGDAPGRVVRWDDDTCFATAAARPPTPAIRSGAVNASSLPASAPAPGTVSRSPDP